MNDQFKVGDIIRCTNVQHNVFIIIDRLYRVLHDPYDNQLWVIINPDGKGPLSYSKECFEIAKDVTDLEKELL